MKNLKIILGITFVLIILTLLSNYSYAEDYVAPSIDHGNDEVNTTPEVREIEKVFLKNLPDKIEYIVGEELDLEGCEIIVGYNDGTFDTVKVTEENSVVSGYDPRKSGSQQVTISYKSNSVMFYAQAVKPDINYGGFAYTESDNDDTLRGFTEITVTTKNVDNNTKIEITIEDSEGKDVTSKFTINGNYIYDNGALIRIIIPKSVPEGKYKVTFYDDVTKQTLTETLTITGPDFGEEEEPREPAQEEPGLEEPGEDPETQEPEEQGEETEREEPSGGQHSTNSNGNIPKTGSERPIVIIGIIVCVIFISSYITITKSKYKYID